MENLIKKAVYLKGLCDGLDISESTKEGKLLVGVIDLLEEMTSKIRDLSESYDELDSYVESIDEAVVDLEEVIFEDEDGCGCEHDEDSYIDIECPNCGDKIFLDEEMFTGQEILCPNCNEPISFESSCGGCDCSCSDEEKN